MCTNISFFLSVNVILHPSFNRWLQDIYVKISITKFFFFRYFPYSSSLSSVHLYGVIRSNRTNHRTQGFVIILILTEGRKFRTISLSTHSAKKSKKRRVLSFYLSFFSFLFDPSFFPSSNTINRSDNEWIFLFHPNVFENIR